jgi:uncharacterized cupredoxin-like copper-binding protein
MPRLVIVLLAGLAVVLAACSASPTSGSASPTASGSLRVIHVTTTDALRFQPNAFEVSVGETVRFEVTNADTIRHEFFIGDEDAQDDHEAEMVEMGGMLHDEPNGISVEPGEVKGLEHTFDAAGSVLIGCHEAGHYAGGMVATVTVGE